MTQKKKKKRPKHSAQKTQIDTCFQEKLRNTYWHDVIYTLSEKRRYMFCWRESYRGTIGRWQEGVKVSIQLSSVQIKSSVAVWKEREIVLLTKQVVLKSGGTKARCCDHESTAKNKANATAANTAGLLSSSPIMIILLWQMYSTLLNHTAVNKRVYVGTGCSANIWSAPVLPDRTEGKSPISSFFSHASVYMHASLRFPRRR